MAGAAIILPAALSVSSALIVGSSAIWAAFALRYRMPGGRVSKTIALLLWAGVSTVVLAALWQGRVAAALLTFSAAFGGLLIWWRRIAPSNDRVWADDVAQMSSGTVEGNRVTLRNVRNFDWRTETDYTQRWETRGYDLDRLNSVDMIMSYWRGPAIAHMLISFGFENGEHVVFSVEVRRELGQTFSEIGGFFKEFELSIIAADERDVIRLRTNVRGEDDYLYRLRIPVAAIRTLFLSYIDEANSLIAAPRFYNTLTVNCTMLVYHMMRRIVGHLPIDYRLIFSGYLPEYAYRVGGLDRRYPLRELRERGRITDRAKRADRSAAFSAQIRHGVPGIGAAAAAPDALKDRVAGRSF